MGGRWKPVWGRDAWAAENETERAGRGRGGCEVNSSSVVEGVPSIKQVFEKGRQREKVSAKYLKECREERGARPEGDKAVSRTLRSAPVSLAQVTAASVLHAHVPCSVSVCVRACVQHAVHSPLLSVHPSGRGPTQIPQTFRSALVCVHGPARSLTKARWGEAACGAARSSPGHGQRIRPAYLNRNPGRAPLRGDNGSLGAPSRGFLTPPPSQRVVSLRGSSSGLQSVLRGEPSFESDF